MNSRILDDENSSPVRKFIDRNGRRKEEEEGQCSFATLEKDGNLFNKLHSEFRNFVSLSLFKKGIQRNEVEAEVHDCCELYNNERIFKKFRFENCKSLKFFILRSERYSVEGVTRDFKKGARYNNKRNIFLFDSSLAWLWLSCRCCFRLEVDAVADAVVSCRFNDGIEVPRVYEPRAFPLDFPLPPL